MSSRPDMNELLDRLLQCETRVAQRAGGRFARLTLGELTAELRDVDTRLSEFAFTDTDEWGASVSHELYRVGRDLGPDVLRAFVVRSLERTEQRVRTREMPRYLITDWLRETARHLGEPSSYTTALEGLPVDFTIPLEGGLVEGGRGLANVFKDVLHTAARTGEQHPVRHGATNRAALRFLADVQASVLAAPLLPAPPGRARLTELKNEIRAVSDLVEERTRINAARHLRSQALGDTRERAILDALSDTDMMRARRDLATADALVAAHVDVELAGLTLRHLDDLSRHLAPKAGAHPFSLRDGVARLVRDLPAAAEQLGATGACDVIASELASAVSLVTEAGQTLRGSERSARLEVAHDVLVAAQERLAAATPSFPDNESIEVLGRKGLLEANVAEGFESARQGLMQRLDEVVEHIGNPVDAGQRNIRLVAGDLRRMVEVEQILRDGRSTTPVPGSEGFEKIDVWQLADAVAAKWELAKLDDARDVRMRALLGEPTRFDDPWDAARSLEQQLLREASGSIEVTLHRDSGRQAGPDTGLSAPR